jgi:D-proline reductase (dithiol) PrdB
LSLIARALEASGLPTLCMSCLWEISAAFKPPRAVFLDFPIGCPAGRPGEPALQREILRAALDAAPTFGEPWRIVELPFQWSPDGSRDWEETVRELYRREVSTVARHTADHRARGESLLGREEAFTIRCHC